MSYSCSTLPNLTTFNWQHLFTDCCLSVWWTDKRKPAKSDSVAIPQQTRWPHFHAFEHFTLFFFFWLLFTHSATAPQLTADTYTTTTTSFWQIAQPFLPARCIHLPAAALRTVPRHRQGITKTQQTLRHEGYDYTAYTGGQRHSLTRDEGGQKAQILRSWDNSNIQAWTETKKDYETKTHHSKQCQENLKTFHFAKSLLFISVSTFLNTFVSGRGGATQW